MAYLEILDLKNSAIIEPIKDCTDDAQLQYLIDYCTMIIEAYTKTDFNAYPNESKLVSGDGEQIIALPQRMYNLTQVYDVIHNMEYTDVLLLDNCKEILIPELTTPERVMRNKFLINHKCRTHLNHDYDEHDLLYQYKITGDWGWETVPPKVIQCLIILCNQNFDALTNPEVISKIGSPFISEKLGNYSYQLRNSYQGLNTQEEAIGTTGNPYVDQILDIYRVSDYSIGVI